MKCHFACIGLSPAPGSGWASLGDQGLEDRDPKSGQQLTVEIEAAGSVTLSSWVPWHSLSTAGEAEFRDGRALGELQAVSLTASLLALPVTVGRVDCPRAKPPCSRVLCVHGFVALAP